MAPSARRRGRRSARGCARRRSSSPSAAAPAPPTAPHAADALALPAAARPPAAAVVATRPLPRQRGCSRAGPRLLGASRPPSGRGRAEPPGREEPPLLSGRGRAEPPGREEPPLPSGCGRAGRGEPPRRRHAGSCLRCRDAGARSHPAVAAAPREALPTAAAVLREEGETVERIRLGWGWREKRL
ncbi:hypothetical protein BS78_07G049000 [Paspalum vaginatum]|nr:hypothetical protein BS78_07G049000 [Paspalum vaginatum]